MDLANYAPCVFINWNFLDKLTITRYFSVPGVVLFFYDISTVMVHAYETSWASEIVYGIKMVRNIKVFFPTQQNLCSTV